jgi:hypothetical protein
MAIDIKELEEYIDEKKKIYELGEKIKNASEYDLKLGKTIKYLANIIDKKIIYHTNDLNEIKKYYNFFIKNFIKNSFDLEEKDYYNKKLQQVSLDTCEGFINEITTEQTSIEVLVTVVKKSSATLINLLSSYQAKQVLSTNYSNIITDDYDLLEQILKLDGESLVRKFIEMDEENAKIKGVITKEEPLSHDTTHIKTLKSGELEIYSINYNKAYGQIYKLIKTESCKLLKKGVNNKSLKRMLENLNQLICLIQDYYFLESQSITFLNLNSKIFNENLEK